jgi:hypothetical protein
MGEIQALPPLSQRTLGKWQIKGIDLIKKCNDAGK